MNSKTKGILCIVTAAFCFAFYVAVRPAGGRSAIYAEDIVP